MLSKYSLSDHTAADIPQAVELLATQGFAVVDNFLPASAVSDLSREIDTLASSAQMQAAGTGRTHKIVNPNLRGDTIFWLEEPQASPAQQVYFQHMEQLRLALNQSLYLGLFGLECHLAQYAAGTRYQLHIDRFKGASNGKPLRQVSCILYLNEDWQESCGGHLRLYLDPDTHTDEQSLDILPIAGRLVLFLSDTFYHEVLPATRERKSLTGWFLTR